MAFQRAERRRAYIKAAITGPSGSGKTYSALRIAFGLVGPAGKVAVIDTENGSASLYADVGRDGIGPYDVLEIGAPFLVQRYVDAIAEAVRGGYEVLVMDSLTHAWSGEGGLLAQKEALDSRGGNKFTNWAPISRQHEEFKAAILQAPIHVLATMRSKTEYVVGDEAGGRGAAPKKVGLAPVQREGMEYEFTVVFDVAPDHSAIVSKDRTGLFNGLNQRLTEDHGRTIARWLDGAAPAIVPGPERAAQAVQGAERAASYAEASAPAPSAGDPEPAGGLWTAPTGPESSGDRMATATRVCTGTGCGKPLTQGQHDVSMRAFGQPLCPACQKAAKAAGSA